MSDKAPATAGSVGYVVLARLPVANATNARGRRTFEFRPWEAPYGEQRPGILFDNPQSTYYYRLPGEVCGGHCHRGDNPGDPDRNPEQILFFLGSARVELEDLWGKTRVVHVEVLAGQPQVLTIPPWVLHTFRVGELGVHFAEVKRNPFSRDPALQDVCSEDEFRQMQHRVASLTPLKRPA
ncbi:hypothetical protein EXS62_01100 [Candidatus Kaiserbacteria bacterium]|nr:hypothetical protein [Candidatus Kaiserbacteria bacterium]